VPSIRLQFVLGGQRSSDRTQFRFDLRFFLVPGLGFFADYPVCQPRRECFPQVFEEWMFAEQDEPGEAVAFPGPLQLADEFLADVEDAIFAMTGDGGLTVAPAFASGALPARNLFVEFGDHPRRPRGRGVQAAAVTVGVNRQPLAAPVDR